MSDWKRVLGLLLLAILALAFIEYVYGPVSAATNLTNISTLPPTPQPPPTDLPTPTRTMAPTPIPTPPYRVGQGDTVYLGDTVDVTGVLAGVLNLAYYGGYDEDIYHQYLVKLPESNRGYYFFYIDPAIYSTRLGNWYKWRGEFNRGESTIAFVVAERRNKPNVSANITLQNPNQTPVAIRPPTLPDRHVADYLIARGDSMAIPATNQTKAWIFGPEDFLYDYKAVNGTIDLKTEIVDKLTPGTYTLMLHMRDANSNGEFTVRYNPDTSTIDWFDPVTFEVQHYDVSAQTPENVMNKLKSILPAAHDTFKLYSLEIQAPTIDIAQIDTEIIQNTNISAPDITAPNIPTYIEVRGYTNAAPDTVVKLVVDPDFNMNLDQMFKEATVTRTEGTSPGDMRVFRALVPVYLYDTRLGEHFVVAKTAKSNTFVTASFDIYENWKLQPIPNKTIRYISGKYGPQELIPTPTPIVVTQVVTKVVTQIITVPVTPSNEQVYAQQKLASEKTWWEGAWWLAKGITGSLFLIGGMWYGVSVARRLKE
jgi:hypothetical protein